MENGIPRLSFGFSKSKKNTALTNKPAISVEIKSNDSQRDYLTSFENFTAQSVKQETVNELVIPLKPSRSNIHVRLAKRYVKVDPDDQLTVDAINALTSEDNLQVECTKPTDSSLVVNVPENVLIDDAEDADYSAIPIEKYGMALLKGMGFKTETRGPSLDDYAEKVRLKGLGLGADPKVLLASRQKEKAPLSGSNEKLAWIKGAKCQVIFGRREGQYGVIDGLDGDTGRVVVRMTVTKQVHSIMQSTLRLVTSAEYEKFSKYLNTAAAAKYKEEESAAEKLATTNTIPSKRVRKSDSFQDAESRLTERTSSNLGDRESSWVREGLVVRYINDHGHYAKYCDQKVTVLSTTLTPSFTCSCETKHGRILKDIRPRDLRTTIPRDPGVRVLIVRGEHDGEIAELLESETQTETASVLLSHSGIKLYVGLDDICLFSK